MMLLLEDCLQKLTGASAFTNCVKDGTSIEVKVLLFKKSPDLLKSGRL